MNDPDLGNEVDAPTSPPSVDPVDPGGFEDQSDVDESSNPEPSNPESEGQGEKYDGGDIPAV